MKQNNLPWSQATRRARFCWSLAGTGMGKGTRVCTGSCLQTNRRNFGCEYFLSKKREKENSEK